MEVKVADTVGRPSGVIAAYSLERYGCNFLLMIVVILLYLSEKEDTPNSAKHSIFLSFQLCDMIKCIC